MHNNYESSKPIGLGFNANSTELVGGVPTIVFGNGEETIFDSGTAICGPGNWYIFTKRLTVASKPSTYYLRYIDLVP